MEDKKTGTVKKEGNAKGGEGRKKEEAKFSKEQLVAAKRFQGRRDLIAALLEAGRQYTVAEAEQKIEQYLKGQVN